MRMLATSASLLKTRRSFMRGRKGLTFLSDNSLVSPFSEAGWLEKNFVKADVGRELAEWSVYTSLAPAMMSGNSLSS